MGIILQARGLCYRYESGAAALDGVSLSVSAGERLAVLGCNGSGKSTLFLCLNGVLRPQGGEILLDGKPVEWKKRGLQALRREVGIVFQDPEAQLFSVDVWQEVAFGPYNLGLRGPDLEERVEQTLCSMQLGDLRARPPHALSCGQKKRVCVASVLSMRPRMLIFDEPTSALDPYHTARLLELLEQLHREGIAVMLSTHDVDFAWSWADRVVLLDDGKLLAQGETHSIFSDPALLGRAHLKKPQTLRFYEKLVERHILPAGLAPPRSPDQLEDYLQKEGAAHVQ